MCTLHRKAFKLHSYPSAKLKKTHTPFYCSFPKLHFKTLFFQFPPTAAENREKRIHPLSSPPWCVLHQRRSGFRRSVISRVCVCVFVCGCVALLRQSFVCGCAAANEAGGKTTEKDVSDPWQWVIIINLPVSLPAGLSFVPLPCFKL